MAFSVLIDEDFTLYVEEDNEDETDIPTETVHVKTEPECESDTEYEFESDLNIKEELDFENHFFLVNQYVDINNIKTEIQDEFDKDRISSEKAASNDEEPQADITENIPKPPVLETAEVRAENVPDESSNVTFAIQSDKENVSDTSVKNADKENVSETSVKSTDKENVSETSVKRADSSEILCEKKMHVNTEPLDRRKDTDNKKQENSEPEQLQNNKNNNKKLVLNKNVPKAKKAASNNNNNKSPENWKKPESRQFQNRNNNKALPYKKFPRDQKPAHARFERPQNKTKQLLPYKQLNRPNFFVGSNEHPIPNGPQRQMRGTQQFFQSFVSNNESSLASPPQRTVHWTNPLFRNHPPVARFDERQNLSRFNQTYCTILNAINQALGRQRNQSFHNGDDGFRASHQRRRRPQWQNHNLAPSRPPVWANSLPQREPGPVLNSTQLQTYSTILQAVTRLNGGAITQNIQNWSVNSNNFRFQMSFEGRVSQFANF